VLVGVRVAVRVGVSVRVFVKVLVIVGVGVRVGVLVLVGVRVSVPTGVTRIGGCKVGSGVGYSSGEVGMTMGSDGAGRSSKTSSIVAPFKRVATNPRRVPS
jgi:hypothetical protein